MHEQIAAALAKKPFEPFVIETVDGRQVTVGRRDSAVLNSLTISVVEGAFSVTVLALDQVRAITGEGDAVAP